MHGPDLLCSRSRHLRLAARSTQLGTRRPDHGTTTKRAPHSTNSSLIAQDQRSWHVCTSSDQYAAPWLFMPLILSPEVSSCYHALLGTRRPDRGTKVKGRPHSTSSCLIAQNQRSRLVCTSSHHYATPWPFMQRGPQPEVSSSLRALLGTAAVTSVPRSKVVLVSSRRAEPTEFNLEHAYARPPPIMQRPGSLCSRHRHLRLAARGAPCWAPPPTTPRCCCSLLRYASLEKY